jgi:peroxiredoxin
LQSRINDIHATGAEVLAISVDPVEASKKLAADLKLDYVLLCDPELKVIDAYDVRHKQAGPNSQDIARPATFILDRNGVVRWRELTENYRVRVRPERILEHLAQIP